MSKAVFRYEGTIAQLQGDAMLAFFGAPVAHEDDPDRAIRAALDMVEATDEFARQLKAQRGIDFRIRAGINTGPVIVGNVGSDLRYEYTALGDAVNVAARVQTSAATGPGAGLDEYPALRDRRVRLRGSRRRRAEGQGRAGPAVPCHRRARSARSPSRTGIGWPVEPAGWSIGRAGHATRPVRGRRAGRGRVVVLIGEPGIGKSRLLSRAARRRRAARQNPALTWIEGRCVSYGRTVPYHLVLDMVRSMIGISVSNSEAEERRIRHDAAERAARRRSRRRRAVLRPSVVAPLSSRRSQTSLQIDPEDAAGPLRGRDPSRAARLHVARAGGARVRGHPLVRSGLGRHGPAVSCH